MKFRLKKTDDVIELEQLLKAVKADEDYQKIRFMIKDGLIYVNGEKEYARRRLLKTGDKVSYGKKYYTVCNYKGNEPEDIIKQKAKEGDEEYVPQEHERVFHHQKPLSWSKKYSKKD